MLISQFDKFVNRSTQEILGSQIEQENLVPMLSTDIVRSGGDVTGVKGEKEVYYRTGNVNLTSADIGALDEDNVYNGLDQTASGYALDARQGKTLADDVAGLADDVAGKLDKANVYNGLDQTEAGYALDARQGKVLNDKINATQSDIAIIIEGNQTTHTGGVAVGEYVIVRNSTISSIADGLYTAVKVIPANTVIDSTYLDVVDGGGLNVLNNNLTYVQTIVPSRSGDQINGGYIKAGKIVVVNIRIEFASNVPVNTNVFSLPNAQTSTMPSLVGFKDEYGKRGNIVPLRLLSGDVLTNTELSAGSYVFTGSYISNN